MVIVKDGFICCPVCKGKTRVKVISSTKAVNLPLFCPKCKNETIVDYESGNLVKTATLKPVNMGKEGKYE